MPAPESDLALLEEAVREAGKIARRFYGGTFKKWNKAAGSPVTEADIAVDRFLTETLRSARPDYGWLSEETEDDPARLSAARVFIVDPIDGTLAFVKNRPHFTICAGVVENGRPIAGVVYNPIAEECFRARAGGGAELNGAPIHASARKDVEGCRMLGDKPMFALPGWSEPPNIPWPAMEIETRSSIAYRVALVASGQFDAMLALTAKHDWDLAAADIILTEAGGKLTTHDGRVLRYNGTEAIQPSVVGAGPALHAELLKRVGHLNLQKRRH